jgi:hypothetical protein|tara:strand:+ start:148 stop:486 length:339 start_codon:yes stop_codon:yes gene_type:complete
MSYYATIWQQLEELKIKEPRIFSNVSEALSYIDVVINDFQEIENYVKDIYPDFVLNIKLAEEKTELIFDYGDSQLDPCLAFKILAEDIKLSRTGTTLVEIINDRYGYKLTEV